jgi:hypothetical protein
MMEVAHNNSSKLSVLLAKKRYDDALSIATDLVKKYPAHKEFYLIRLLIIRILVLQWTLSHPAIARTNDESSLPIQAAPSNKLLVIVAKLKATLATAIPPVGRFRVLELLQETYRRAK